MYNYNHLFYFYICAQFKSISKGAAYLNTSQPSLSIQIKTLEESLDLDLFFRNGRNLELTNSGKIIFSFCERMFSETQNISNFIKTKTINQRENLTIGVSEQIERPYIADIIGSLIKQYKKTDMPKIKMQTLPSNEMLSLLKINQMDMVVTHEKINSKNWELFTLDIPIALVGVKKHFSNNNRKNKIKTFFNDYKDGIIIPIDSFKLRTETDLFFSKNNISPDIIFESGNLSANIRAICEGLGVGLMPIIYTLKEIKNGKLSFIMSEGDLWEHSIYIYCSKSSLEKKPILDLINLFKKSVDINAINFDSSI